MTVTDAARQWMASFEERVEQRWEDIPGVSFRKQRKATSALVIHGIGDGDRGVVGDSFGDVERFFLDDPEGVATVTVGGPYSEKVKTFTKWWDKRGKPGSWFHTNGVPKSRHRHNIPTKIPLDREKRAFVPYHFGISGERIVQWLPWQAVGAHASGWNFKSVAVSIVRDMKNAGPLTTKEGIALSDVITYAHLRAAGLKVLTHDQANVAAGINAKGCPGVDVSQTVSWALSRAQIMSMDRRF